jgi:adenosylhomocysteine nucleosidase
MTEIEQQRSDLAHADVGLVCALPVEIAAFMARCENVRKYTGGKFTFRGGRYDEIRIAAVESGMGFAQARSATHALIEAHTPPWVLSVGFAGALCDGMKVGEIVMADSIVDTHGHEMKIDLALPGETQPGLHAGRVVTADAIVRKVADKRQLAAELGGIAVDMESLAVAQVCRETGTRFLAVRVISDDMSADLPLEILSVVGSTGSMRVGAALGSIWKRPASVKDMWKLRETAHAAAERLATFLDGVVRQLNTASR